MSGIHNVIVDGRRTSMRLEPEIWSALTDIAALEGLSVSEICTLIKNRRRSSNLTSAVRVFTLLYAQFRGLARALEELGLASEQPATLVPPALEKATILERRRSDAAAGSEEALIYRLESLLAFPHPLFKDVIHCWHALRPSAPPRLPSPSSVWAYLEALRTAVPPDPRDQIFAINLIDVRPENPRSFKLGPTQSVNRMFAGKDISHAAIAEHPFALHAQAMQMDFNRVKSEGAPQFHVLRHIFDGVRRHYARLALPLSEGGSDVDAILTVSARLSPPSFDKHRLSAT